MGDILARIDATIAACEHNPAVEWVETNMPDVKLTNWQRDILRRFFPSKGTSPHVVIFDELWPSRRRFERITSESEGTDV